MKIQQIVSQSRRDFTAIYECEHCGATEQSYGYDDAYFHQSVIPAKACRMCGKTAGSDYQPREPKYPADAIV